MVQPLAAELKQKLDPVASTSETLPFSRPRFFVRVASIVFMSTYLFGVVFLGRSLPFTTSPRPPFSPLYSPPTCPIFYTSSSQLFHYLRLSPLNSASQSLSFTQLLFRSIFALSHNRYGHPIQPHRFPTTNPPNLHCAIGCHDFPQTPS